MTHIRVFFYLSELPLSFTENFSVDQIIRFATLIEKVKQTSSLEMTSSSDSEMIQEQNQNEYFEALDSLKKIFADFIQELTINQLFQIINLFPMLIEEDQMKLILEDRSQFDSAEF